MKRITFILVLAALLVATTGAVSAKATRVYFTGWTWCDPDSVTALREWMAGPIYQGKGLTQDCHDMAFLENGDPFPQMIGVEHIAFNYQGYPFILAGKDYMETDEGGEWVGSWAWPANTWIIRIIMQGQGKYAGMQLRMFEDASNDTFWGYVEYVGN